MYISIIIPHKNIPKLLQRCLDSIPLRDDLEVIVVDDNSDSSIVDFEHFPGKDRPDTKVILDKSGKGAGHARNVGLDNSKGKWIVFADADDIFTKDFSNILIEIETKDADEFFFKVESKDSTSFTPGYAAQYINDAIDLALSNSPDYSQIKYRIDVPWGKIQKHSFLLKKDIRFEEVPVANDARFSAMCDFFAESIEIIPIVGYCYMTREGSLWRTNTAKSLEVRFNVCMGIFRFMKIHKDEDTAIIYKWKGLNFLLQMISYSKILYLKNYIIYGFLTHSYRVFIIDIPKSILGCGIRCVKIQK